MRDWRCKDCGLPTDPHTTMCFRCFSHPQRHGTSCPKVEHIGGGLLHSPEDDGPYEVDGLTYCGRCHYWIGDEAR